MKNPQRNITPGTGEINTFADCPDTYARCINFGESSIDDICPRGGIVCRLALDAGTCFYKYAK